MESQLQSQSSVVPLSYIVRLTQMDLDDFSSTQYEKLLQYSILGFQELNFGTINSVKVAYLEMSDINTVKLPSDYVDYYKIGMPIGGEIWNLSINNNILLPRDIDCGEDIRDVIEGGSSISSGYYYTPHYSNGTYNTAVFGISGGFRESYYRIDSARGQIIFSSTVPRNEIVLEYKASGISAQTMVPRTAINVLSAYVYWRRLRGKRRDSERREAEREWKEELSQFRAYTFRFNKTEYLNSLYMDRTQVPRR